MKITIDPNTGNRLYIADEGRAIAQRGESGPTTITTANAPAATADDAWHDCDYGEQGGEATETDMLEALRKFGVEV